MISTSRFQHSLAAFMAASIAAGAVVVPTTAIAQQQTTCTDDKAVFKVTGGEFEWDFRDSWNNYIHGPIAHGTSELTGGITNLNEANKAKSNYKFVASKGVSTGVNQAELNVDGTMHYQGHKHGDNYVLDNTFSNFNLKAEGSKLELYADVHYRKYVNNNTAGEWQDAKQIKVSEWTLKQPLALKAGDVAFASNDQGKFGSQDVINALGGFYKDDIHTGAITGKVKVSRECPPVPSTSAKPSSEPTKPTSSAAKPSSEAAKPSSSAVKPTSSVSKPSSSTTSSAAPAPAPNPNPGEPTAPGSSNSQFIKVLAGLGVAGAILAAIFGFLQHSNIPLPFRI